MKKRVLAALLALVMLFGALPMSVFAENVDVGLNDTGDNEAVVRTAPAEGPNLSDFGFVWRFVCNDKSCDDYNTTIHQTSGTLNVLGGEQKRANADGTYTVYADESAVTKYINKTNELAGYKFASSKVDAVIEWNEMEEKWQLQDTPSSNTIYMYVYVDHTNVDDEPHGIPSELQTDRYITFVCLDTTCTSSHSTTSLKITDKMYSNVSKDRTVYRLRFDDDVVKQAIEDSYTDHEQAIRGSYKIYPSFINWKWQDGKWVIQEDGWPDKIAAYMKPKEVDPGVIPAPTKENLDIANLSVFFKCAANGRHSVSVPYGDGTYTIEQKDDTAWLTFDIASYMKAAGLNESHALADPTAVNPKRTFRYDAGTRTWKQSGASNGPQIDVICKATLTYDANGSNVKNMPNPISVTQTLELPSKTTEFALSNTIPERVGYKFLGWATEANSNNPTFPVENLGTANWVSTTGNLNYILYAVWKEVEVIPEPKEIVGTSNVKVFCLNPAAGQPNCNKIEYGASLAFKRTLTKDETNEKHYTLELNAEIYANAYTGNRGKGNESVAHNLYSSDTLTWDLYYKDGKWNAYPRETGVDDVVLVTHAPQKWEEVDKIANRAGVDTTCVTSGKYANYGLTVPFVYYGSNTKPYHDQVISVEYDEKTKSYDATFKADTFADSIAKVCGNSQLAHKLTTKEALTWTFSVKSVEGTTASWKAEPKTADDAKITVRCLTDVNAYITPVTSDGEDLLLNAGIELDAQTLGRIGLKPYGDDGRVLLGDFRSNTVAAADGDDYFGDEDSAFIANVVKDMLLDLMPASGIDEDKLLASGVLGRTDWTNVHIGAEEEDETYLNGNLRFYSVEFHPNAAGDTVENMPTAKYSVGALEYYDFYVEGEKIAKPTEPPTRAGYTFTGWYTNVNCTEAFDFDTAKVMGDVTLYAG